MRNTIFIVSLVLSTIVYAKTSSSSRETNNKAGYVDILPSDKKDAILIPGNSLGAGTILQATGQVVAIGPRNIEHDAPTYAGNSGSPIILKKNWNVVGIDTYSKNNSLKRWDDKFSFKQPASQIKNDVRLFGYRLDSIPSNGWERIKWSEWRRQIESLEKMRALMDSIYDAVTGKHISETNDRRVYAIFKDFDNLRYTAPMQVWNSAKKTCFLLKSLIGTDMVNFPSWSYNFLREDVKFTKERANAYRAALETDETAQCLMPTKTYLNNSESHTQPPTTQE